MRMKQTIQRFHSPSGDCYYRSEIEHYNTQNNNN